jgi:hypothetical protein
MPLTSKNIPRLSESDILTRSWAAPNLNKSTVPRQDQYFDSKNARNLDESYILEALAWSQGLADTFKLHRFGFGPPYPEGLGARQRGVSFGAGFDKTRPGGVVFFSRTPESVLNPEVTLNFLRLEVVYG